MQVHIHCHMYVHIHAHTLVRTHMHLPLALNLDEHTCIMHVNVPLSRLPSSFLLILLAGVCLLPCTRVCVQVAGVVRREGCECLYAAGGGRDVHLVVSRRLCVKVQCMHIDMNTGIRTYTSTCM